MNKKLWFKNLIFILFLGCSEGNISVEYQHYDFGRIIPEKVIEKKLKIFNNTKKVVWIDKIETNCACSAAVTDSTAIKPFSFSVINFKAKTGSSEGLRNKSMRIVLSNNLPMKYIIIGL